jgi:hypothetical protein
MGEADQAAVSGPLRGSKTVRGMEACSGLPTMMAYRYARGHRCAPDEPATAGVS